MSQLRTTTFDVTGMSCVSCVRHVESALRDLPGVTEVEVRLAEGSVHVAHDAEEASIARMAEAIEAAGYEATAHPA